MLSPLQHFSEKMLAAQTIAEHPQSHALPEEIVHRLIVVVAMNIDRPIA
jgi:hypothetical protein